MWWQQDALEQFLRDFLRDALRRRGLNPLLSAQHENPGELLSAPRDFGFTSLDMVQLASRFAACMGMDRTGVSDLLLARRSAKGWCDVARRSRQINDEELGFYSSGSTGNPQLSRHPFSKLQAEAEFFARTLPACQRIVITVPSHHIYGFIWGILLPAEAKVPSVFVNTDNSLPTSWVQQLNNDDMIVATPDTWQLLKELGLRLPERFVAVSSTAPLAPDIAAFFRSAYPQATLAEIYGSTETAGLGWRTRAHGGYTLLPWWQLTQSQQSTTVVSSISDETHLLQDRLQLDADGRIQVLGRTDNVIQIAGHNINLDTLAQKISLHADVESAHVQTEHQQGGQRLHYFLALSQEPDNPGHWCLAFARWLEQQLGDTPAPATVVIAARLPRGVNNKVVTWDPTHYEPVIGVYRSAF